MSNAGQRHPSIPASLLTHKKGMTAVTSARFGEIVDRYSNPYLPGTAAARLNKLLRNPSLSSDLVQNAIIDAICDVMRLHPERDMSERYIAGIAKGIHLERIFQRELHIPATLLREGDAYERLRGELLTEGTRATLAMEDEIWDRAVTVINDRQLKSLNAGERRSIRILPLHDGRSPVTGAPMPSGGLREWKAALQQASASISTSGETMEWMAGRRSEWDEPEYFAAADGFEPDQQWLDDHEITAQMLQDMDDEAIVKAGFDPGVLRDMVRQSKRAAQTNSGNKPVLRRKSLMGHSVCTSEPIRSLCAKK